MIELIKGLILGLLLSFLLGPVFFALIQTSIEKGFRAGLFMAIGVSISDTIYMFLTYTSVSVLSNNDKIEVVLGFIGSIIMILLGVFTFLKPVPKKSMESSYFESNNYLKKIVKGFLLNGINPFIFIFWLGIAGMVHIKLDYSFDQAVLFYIGVIVMVLSADITKAFLAHRLRDYITTRLMKIMNRSVGIALILFGFRLLFFAMELKQML
jgi:threonine/homoserine/homoserine lactone efflux protein